MKFAIGFITFIVVVCINTIYGFPPIENTEPLSPYSDSFGNNLETYNVDTANVRQKRFTCDFLSIFNVNSAACAVHCLGHGYRGGWCDSRAVCNCR